jgi:hypothetical protein
VLAAGAAQATVGSLPLVWHVEHDAASAADMATPDPSTLTLRFAIGGGRRSNQFAALVGAVAGGLTAYSGFTFTAHADRPMRVAVQLRPAGRDNPPRWQRSVYLDDAPRRISIAFADMQPVPRSVTGAAPLASIDAVMFVIDTNNTAPGTSGTVTIGGLTWSALH